MIRMFTYAWTFVVNLSSIYCDWHGHIILHTYANCTVHMGLLYTIAIVYIVDLSKLYC